MRRGHIRHVSADRQRIGRTAVVAGSNNFCLGKPLLNAVRIHLHRAGSAGDIARDGDVRPGTHAEYRREVERLATSACGVPESQLFAGQENLERIVLADQVLSVGNQPVRVEPERHGVGRQIVQQARTTAEVIVGAVKMDGIRVVYQAQHRRIVGTGDGDHQIRTAAVAVRIRDGVDKGLSQRLAGIECVDRGVGVVDAVAVAAIGVDRQAAISAVKGRSHRLVCATKADGTDRRGRAVSSDAVSHIICATSGKDVTSGAGRRRRGAFADAVGVGVGRGHVVNDANGQCGAAGAATFIEDRQGNAVRGLCNPRLAQVGFERVAVGQCARGGDAPDTGAAGVAAQRQCAFARVNHHLCGGQIAQLGTAHRGATNGDAGQSVKRRDRHGTGGGLSGVA